MTPCAYLELRKCSPKPKETKRHYRLILKNSLSGRVVETERLEFKEGWNPLAILHTMCAFANDINNWGGGYIVIGVGEKSGSGDFLVEGLTTAEISRIQKELLGLSHKMKPDYFPIVDVANV